MNDDIAMRIANALEALALVQIAQMRAQLDHYTAARTAVEEAEAKAERFPT